MGSSDNAISPNLPSSHKVMSNKNGAAYARQTDAKVRGYRQAQERYDYNKVKLGMDIQTNGIGECRFIPWLNAPDTDGKYSRLYSNVHCATSLDAIELAIQARERWHANQEGS